MVSRIHSWPFLAKRGVLILFIFLLVGLVFFLIHERRTRSAIASAGEFRDLNVLLVTIDTLRADHLPLYGYRKVKTPHLDELAEKSLVFQNAFAHTPLTLPSHASILTGLLPIGHGVRDNGDYVLDPKVTTLAEILQANGYATAAFVSAFVLDSQWQLDHGFQLYFDDFELANFQNVLYARDLQRRAEVTEVELESWLYTNKDRRFFAWIHYYDPHDPYDPPEPFKSQYASSPYDGEIAYTDEVLGRLLAKLKELQLEDRTIMVLTGDHGESLGEHGELTHGMFLYKAALHVPLVIRLPSVKSQSIEAVVRHMDIAPTILEWLGLQAEPSMQGRSLIPAIAGKERQRRAVYSESLYAENHYGWGRLESMLKDNYKLIRAPIPELYDQKTDPGETRNLIREKPGIAKALGENLQEIIETQSRKDLKGPQKMDPETEEKLRALGYVGGTATRSEHNGKIDPKDGIHLHRGLSQAYAAFLQKDNKAAIEVLLPILKEDPNMIEAHFMAGVAYAEMGNYKEAIPELLKTIQFEPANTMALYNLGYAYQMLGNSQEAELWYQKTLKYDEDHMFAIRKLAQLYVLLNESEKAKPFYLKAVKYYEDSLKTAKDANTKSELYSILAEIHFSAGDIAAAETNLRAAVVLLPQMPTLHYNLAQVYEARGNLEEAKQEYRKEVEIDPSNFRAFHNLGLLNVRSNQLNEAILCFQKVVQLRPADPQAYVLLASVYQKLGKPEEAGRILQQVQMLKRTETDKM